MHNCTARHVLALVTLAALIAMVPVMAAAQTEPKKPGLWQQIKDAAKQGQQGQPGQPQKPGQKPGQATAPASATNLSGSFTPPPGTKVEEQALAPVESGGRFYVSPHGVHVAAIVTRGSRVVVIYDNVEGPKFDEIVTSTGGVVFSLDGSRYAYCGRSGNEMVVMVDGKELIRSADKALGRIDFNLCMIGFTSNSKHVFYESRYNPPNRSNGFVRVVFDGKPGPDGLASDPVFSPDGDHYAYVINEVDAGNRDHWALIVDGKPAGYQGGDPQWTGDSKHLFTILSTNLPGKGTVEDLQVDGRSLMRASNIEAFAAPAGEGVVSVVTIGTGAKGSQFLAVGNKKIPGTDIDSMAGAVGKVVFSPDGKHFAAPYDSQNHHWVMTDGKKGLEYEVVDHLGFNANSSKVVYQARANNKYLIVEGEEESEGYDLLFPPVIAPVGDHVGALVNTMNNQHFLVMDGKSQHLSSPVVDLTFSPDGGHYAYWKYEGGGLQIVLDGTPQPASSLGQNVQQKFVFSPDGNHLAHFGVPNPPTGTTDVGIFIDGKFILLGPRPFLNLSFTADCKHVAWTHTLQNQDFRVFIDGKPVVDGSLASASAGWWDMSPDGRLMFLSQDDSSLKRITVTPSVDTSVATLTAGGTASADVH